MPCRKQQHASLPALELFPSDSDNAELESTADSTHMSYLTDENTVPEKVEEVSMYTKVETEGGIAP